MEKLTAEMKAEIQAKRQEAEANALIRAGRIAPKVIPSEPSSKKVKVLPEKPINFYRDRVTSVSRSYEVYEYETDNN